jgi:N-acetyl-gamma-glutamyl-phosphate reductase
MNGCDIVFLCLPDAAAIESAALVTNPATAIIDTSTAHRVNDEWTYGFPELTGQRARIALSKRIANPGCHASGFIALVAPLVEAGIIDSGAGLSCFSLTGYSGGGKKMIAAYGDADRSALYDAPRVYGLTQAHKHLPEMSRYTGLERMPVFCPIVADFYAGMEVTVPLHRGDISGSLQDIADVYRRYYTQGLVRFNESADPDGMLSACAFSGLDTMDVGVFGNDDRITLVSRFDNLGKGASGAAIQNMNILLGVSEAAGLQV